MQKKASSVSIHRRWAASLSVVCLIAAAAHARDADWVDRLDPIAESDWGEAQARHLLERAGFGGTPDEVARYVALGPRRAVERLVRFEGVEQSLPAFEHAGIWKPGMDPFPKSRADAVRQGYEHGESMGVAVDESLDRPLQPIVDRFFYLLRADVLEARRAAHWWAARMLETQRPLQEKMALFWHGHFATSDSKVRDYRKLLLQLELFHREGLGNFRELLLGVTKDPAMLVYLDNGENLKDHPNENFGREILEMFSMGVGHYTERDIREASRAFTGWTQERLEFVVHEEHHDDGVKEIFGRKGRFDGEDVIDLILEQPQTARYIAGKIYRAFVRDEPSEDVLVELARELRESSYDLAAFMTTLLLSKDFYSPPSVGTQIKSPVHLLVSTYRKMGLDELPGIPDFNSATASLGQLLFHPPNVAGWAGGRAWITGASLLERGELVRQILFPDVAGFRPPDRQLPGIYRSVGDRIAQGMNITQATSSGSSAFNEMANANEDYNTRYGGYRGYVLAWEVVPPLPRNVATLSVAAMLNDAGATNARAAVDALAHRFLSVPLDEGAALQLVAFLPERTNGQWSESDEELLRQLLHLLLSLPEYQLA